MSRKLLSARPYINALSEILDAPNWSIVHDEVGDR